MWETKQFKFNDLKFYKPKFEVQFNHFMFAVISKALKSKFGASEAPHIVSTFPVNVRSQYDNPNKIVLENKLGAVIFELPLIDTLDKSHVQYVKTKIDECFDPESNRIAGYIV